MKQQSFSFDTPQRRTHGGKVRAGKAKLARPLSTKCWIHTSLKSDVAKGELSLLRKEKVIQNLLTETAKKCFVELGDAIIMRNHIHLRVRILDRKLFAKFMRVVAGTIAKLVTGAKKGQPFGKFWTQLIWTRILKSSFEFLVLKNYFEGNRIEKEMGYDEREEYLQKTRQYHYNMRYKNSG
jgi:hypothetical protein